MSISIDFGAIRSWNKSSKPLFWRSRSLNSVAIESQCMTFY